MYNPMLLLGHHVYVIERHVPWKTCRVVLGIPNLRMPIPEWHFAAMVKINVLYLIGFYLVAYCLASWCFGDCWTGIERIKAPSVFAHVYLGRCAPANPAG